MCYCYRHKHYPPKHEIHTHARAFNFIRQPQKYISTTELSSVYNPKHNKQRCYLYFVNKT